MQIRLLLLALLFTAGVIFSGPGYSADEGILAEYNYYESGKIELNAGDYQQAITHYTNLQKIYPKSVYIPQARLESAYAYYKLGNSQAAIGLLEEFFDDNNQHPNKPYAVYLAGLVRYQEALQLIENTSTRKESDRARATSQQAIDYFTQLQDKFPDSLYSEDARQKTTYLLEKVVLQLIKVEGQNADQDRQKRIKAESERSQTLLMKRPPSHYTLQLVRVADYDAAFKVAVQYQLEKNATIIETTTTEGLGYTLLYGVYPNKREAMQTGAKLPAAILQKQPWVREMSSLQDEIVASRLLAADEKRTPNTSQKIGLSTATSETPAKENKNHTDHERWLLGQPANAYTIQLMASSGEENITAFIIKHRLAGQAYYYRSTREDGSNWYSLLYGSYTNRATAMEESQTIGTQLAIARPWIRSFRGIHNEIVSAAQK